MQKRAQQGDVRERRSSFELLDRESLGSLGKRRLCFSGVVTRSSNPWIGVVSLLVLDPFGRHLASISAATCVEVWPAWLAHVFCPTYCTATVRTLRFSSVGLSGTPLNFWSPLGTDASIMVSRLAVSVKRAALAAFTRKFFFAKDKREVGGQEYMSACHRVSIA